MAVHLSCHPWRQSKTPMFLKAILHIFFASFGHSACQKLLSESTDSTFEHMHAADHQQVHLNRKEYGPEDSSAVIPRCAKQATILRQWPTCADRIKYSTRTSQALENGRSIVDEQALNLPNKNIITINEH